jgi:outer membrane receptor protein involved in Fe transport
MQLSCIKCRRITTASIAGQRTHPAAHDITRERDENDRTAGGRAGRARFGPDTSDGLGRRYGHQREGGGLGQVVITGEGERQQYRQSATSSATRTETPLQELPQSVQVVSRQLMDDLAATRLDDVLLYVSGVAKQNNFGGLWDSYSIRGFSGSDNGGMNILWNGFASNRGYAPARPPTESMDFLKGRRQHCMATAPGGTINVVTKKPQFKAANSLDLSVGSNGTYRSAQSTPPAPSTAQWPIASMPPSSGRAASVTTSAATASSWHRPLPGCWARRHAEL